MSINKVIIVGRLGKDPELKYTPSGAAVCNFTVATSESWADKSGQKQEKTEWHRIVVWGKLGELCNQYLSKGRQVFVEGKIQTRSWEDQSGQKKYLTEVNGTNVQFLGEARQGQARQQQPQQERPAPQENAGSQGNDNVFNQDFNVSTDANYTHDDIPF